MGKARRFYKKDDSFVTEKRDGGLDRLRLIELEQKSMIKKNIVYQPKKIDDGIRLVFGRTYYDENGDGWVLDYLQDNGEFCELNHAKSGRLKVISRHDKLFKIG